MEKTMIAKAIANWSTISRLKGFPETSPRDPAVGHTYWAKGGFNTILVFLWFPDLVHCCTLSHRFNPKQILKFTPTHHAHLPK